MSDTTIAGRVALVSGAGRGIGLALTEALLARGARRVYAGARKPEALATLAAKSESGWSCCRWTSPIRRRSRPRPPARRTWIC